MPDLGDLVLGECHHTVAIGCTSGHRPCVLRQDEWPEDWLDWLIEEAQSQGR